MLDERATKRVTLAWPDAACPSWLHATNVIPQPCAKVPNAETVLPYPLMIESMVPPYPMIESMVPPYPMIESMVPPYPMIESVVPP
ncbi:hypothetical protein [Litchfieldella qijiaojingensis]|uniref:hypothetical protein n=1 Tax=Litchfieldella qijiaojingensis TaxID=980347 RepID=UPI001672BFD3|nr:hypothetical protein [Halomonas qijiaojingensis]